jgi:hypothetical protein
MRRVSLNLDLVKGPNANLPPYFSAIQTLDLRHQTFFVRAQVVSCWELRLALKANALR